MSVVKEEWERIVEKIREQAAQDARSYTTRLEAATRELAAAYEASEYTRLETVYQKAWNLLKVLEGRGGGPRGGVRGD